MSESRAGGGELQWECVQQPMHACLRPKFGFAFKYSIGITRFASMIAPMNQATKDYLIVMGNPYAKLSVVGFSEDLVVWEKPSEFLDFLGQCFSSAQFGRKSPVEFVALASSATALSSRAQVFAKSRLAALVPPVQVAFNRLTPERLKALATKIRSILEEAKVLDASEE